MLTIEDIFKNFKLPLTKERKELIYRAYIFAEKAHRGQKRRSGEDYIQHCLATANILGQIGMGSKTIAAGLLHDVPEDTSITLLELEKEFGSEITSMIEGITKLGRIKLRESREAYFLENLRKMFLAMASDIRVVIIKLADRLHNMQTLQHNPPEKQHRIAMETMEVYVPIANRLGIGEIKAELEDLSFKYLDQKNYAYVKNIQEKFYKEGEQYVNEVIREIKKELDKRGITVSDIHGRAKHLHSLYLKLKRYEMDISRIYDLIAIRIIVPNIADCYETLGIVHEKYRPLIGRIKDYISLPKPNGYQSIHTTIFGPKGRILEVQIRTKKMHNEAEFGIASHWVYNEYEKKKGWRVLFSKKTAEQKESIPWIKQLREWHQETGNNPEKFLEGLQIDFFKNHIFAFTPLGDVIDLPEEATPVDFAYAIHSEIGNRTVGAKVNGKIVTLDYQIKNGDVVDIMTSKEDRKPTQDWLTFVKTSTAKTQIRRKLKRE
ncbi:MAG: RelA/SpoT family protein [Candidatus Moranbacteria bacterium]|jgi:GTP pyrophosphokinase|nr:RelA/SpoT family protein [Candidatus Moranbacteria bacterium]